LLSLGTEARFNTPGTNQGNWTWRYRGDQLETLRKNSSAYLRELAALYGREPVGAEINAEVARLDPKPLYRP
jgi:4-alpha-glucanotransferase